jgi:hypothetical protein
MALLTFDSVGRQQGNANRLMDLAKKFKLTR